MNLRHLPFLLVLPLILGAAESPLPEPISAVFQHADNWLDHGRVLDAKGQPTPLFLDQLDIWTHNAPGLGAGAWSQEPRTELATNSVTPRHYDPGIVELLYSLQSILPSDYGTNEKRVLQNRYALAARAYVQAFPAPSTTGMVSIGTESPLPPPPDTEPALSAAQIAAAIEICCAHADTRDQPRRAAALAAARPWIAVALGRYWENGYFVSGPTSGMEPECDPWRVSSGRSGSSALALAVLRYAILRDGYSSAILRRPQPGLTP